MKILKKLIFISLFNLFIIVSIVSAGSNVAEGKFRPTAQQINPASSADLFASSVLPFPSASPSSANRPSSAPVASRIPSTPKISLVSPLPVASLAPPKNTPLPSAAQCVIMIDGAKYNVTQFRKQHSGGDIFKCSTDMSQIFWARHNQAILQKMQPYRI